MASRGGEEEEEGEHHRNPFLSIGSSKASSSKLQFRNDISTALWDEKKGMGEIVEKKGSVSSSGLYGDSPSPAQNPVDVGQNPEVFFTVSKISFHQASSFGRAKFVVDNAYPPPKAASSKKKNMMEEELKGLCERQGGHLKTLGYIIGRHGIPWTMKKNNRFDSNSSQTTSNPNQTLDPDEEYGISILLEGMLIDDLKLTFDVYLPNSRFRKSSPGDSSFLLCVLRGNPPLKREVESLERNSGGIPIKFCYVNHGLVSFFCFDKVTLPVLP
ncbi:hypothetical protein KSP40_PGU017270 [Platanthera guangdongensis]|uniref:Uncharacterized protein n=1 Tax=Platanthera guangdongensis TaxID=2320717 RepID=A0ABR2N2B9_9ASPA